MPEIVYATPDFTNTARLQQYRKERNEAVYEKTDCTVIYDDVFVKVAASEVIQKPTEDKFQEKMNPHRTAAVCLGLLTLLLLAGIIGLGIHYFHEKTDMRMESGLLREGNANLSSSRDQIQASYNIIAEEANKLKSENYNLTQNISQSEKETAHLQAVNSNITKQRDKLQKMLEERDCCPNWEEFGNHCYKKSTPKTNTWEKSRQDCEQQEAYLVIITSKAEKEFIDGLKTTVWIGLKREDGAWKWVDGSPLTTRYWGNKQPDDYGGKEDCAEMVDTIWNDNDCEKKKKWICEKRK